MTKNSKVRLLGKVGNTFAKIIIIYLQFSDSSNREDIIIALNEPDNVQFNDKIYRLQIQGK